MKIALFAAKAIGLEVASFFGASDEPLACLVLDSRDEENFNSQIIEGSGIADEGRIFYSNSLPRESTVAAIAELNLDLVLLVWWPYIIKKDLIALPRLGCLNFHPSYLPYNRGKNYNFWSIVEGAPFGVTLHWVNENIDSGDIAFQSRIETSWEDTGATLYKKAQEEIVKLFKDKFPQITSGDIPRIKQDLDRGSFHLSRELDEASRIDLDQNCTARQLLNVMRARTFPPHPAAWFEDAGDKYEVRVDITKIKQEQKT